MKNNNVIWNLVSIEDTLSLPGDSILKYIKFLVGIKNFKFVILQGIVGAGQNWIIPQLKKKEGALLPIEDLFEILPNVQQFDWGNFYLFKEKPNDW